MGIFESHDRVDIFGVQQIEGTLFDLARKAAFYVLSSLQDRGGVRSRFRRRRQTNSWERCEKSPKLAVTIKAWESQAGVFDREEIALEEYGFWKERLAEV